MEFSDITRSNAEKITQLADKDLVLAAYQYYNHQMGDAVKAELTVRQLKAMSRLDESTTKYSHILILLTVILMILTGVMVIKMFI